MATITASTFFEILKKSNLLSAKQVAHVRALATQAGLDSNPQAVADALVRKGLLTPWQSSQLLNNRHAFFLGKYKLLDRIGSGGMGAVFKAQHAKLGHIVALKVVSKQRLQQPGAIARFNREIQAVSALHHPNIIEAYDADRVGDTHFLVMEYVAGRDLNGWLKHHGWLPIDWSCEVARQSALGLQHAHDKGLVHRDIKPGNLLVSVDPETNLPLVKVLDMGLARFISEAKTGGDITQTGQILGTPDYIAPEQARDTRNADIRADIFSLGCTLFRIITGRLPFEGNNPVEKLVARYTQDAPPLRSLRPEVPPALEGIVARMMMRDPAQRFQLPWEVAQALEPFSLVHLTHDANHTAAHPVPVAQPVPIPVHPVNNGVRGMVEDSDMSSATGEFLNLLAQQAVDADTPPLSGDTMEAPPSRWPLHVPNHGAQFPAGKAAGFPTSRRFVWLHTLEDMFMALPVWGKAISVSVLLALVLVLGMIGRTVWDRSGQTLLVIDWPAEARNSGRLMLDQRERVVPYNGPLTFSGPPGPRHLVLMRPDYEPVEFNIDLSRGEEKTLRPVWKLTPAAYQRRQAELNAQLRQTELAKLQTRYNQTRGNPNAGSEVARLRSDLLNFAKLWPETQESSTAWLLLRRLTTPLDNLAQQPLPGEYRSLSAQLPALVSVIGAGSNNWLQHNSSVLTLAYSPDNRLLASASMNEVKVWDLAAHGLMATLPSESRGAAALSFSADGRYLATLNYAQQVMVWELPSGQLHFTIDQPNDRTYQMAFHPQTPDVLLTGNINGALQWWNCQTKQATRSLSVYPDKVAVYQLAFSGDGRRVATMPTPRRDASAPVLPIKVWDASNGAPAGEVKVQPVRMGAMSLSADGSEVAFTDSTAANIRVFKVGQAQPHRTLTTPNAFIQRLKYSPNGRTLAASSQITREIHLWDTSSWNPLETVSQVSGYGNSFDFGPGSVLALCNLPSTRLRLYDWTAGRELNEDLGKHDGAVVSLSMNSETSLLATIDHTGKLIVWNTSSGQPDTSLMQKLQAAGLTRVISATFAPLSSKLAIVTHPERKLHLFDLSTGKAVPVPVPPLSPSFKNVENLVFTPDGTQLVVSCNDQSLQVVDVAGGRMIRRIPMPQNTMASLAMHPQGELLAVSVMGKPGVQLWKVANWQPLKELKVPEKQNFRLAFHSEGSRLALLSGGINNHLQFWSIAEDRSLLLKQEPLATMTVHPSGTHLATCSPSGELKIWETRTGTVVQQYALPQFYSNASGRMQVTRSIHELQYTPDGRYLVTANADGTVFILRVET